MLTKQRGFSLVELLVGISLMVFLFAAGISLYTTLMKSFYETLAVNQLDHQLRGAVNLMVEDIRRAGYSANAANDVNVNTNSNPFMASGTDISVPVSSCILFTYDSDSSGILPALDAAGTDKRFGYRLSGNTLQARPLTDTAFSCTSGNWVNISDPGKIQITSLLFTLTPTVLTLSNGVSTLTIRNITISLTGNLVQGSTVTRTVTVTIRVRNDKFSP